MKTALNRRFYLNAAEIDRCSQEVFEYLTLSKVNKKEALRIQLSVEEVLLAWLEHLGAGTEIKLLCSRRLGRQSIRLQCRGVECNPFATDKGEFGEWVNGLKTGLEFLPMFRYSDAHNQVMFNVRTRTVSRLLVTVLAIFAGLVLGFLGMLIPIDIRQTICEKIFTPIYDTYLAAFSLAGIPLIFTSVLTGILGAGDITAFSNNGRKMIGRFLGISVLSALCALLAALPFFHLDFGADVTGLQLGELLSMVLDWVPTGLFQPFINSDAMQLILLGAAFGVAILLLNLTGGHFVSAVNETHRLLQKFAGWLSTLIPAFVLLMIVNSVWNSETAVLLSAWKSWVVTTGMEALIIVVMLLWVAKKYRTSVRSLLQKLSRTFLVALGTNSCTASISDNYACCESLGIDSRAYSFGVPIGTTMFKPATAARLVILCFFMAEAQGTPVSLWWFVTLIIMAVALSIAIPAIPGGVLMFCPVLFAQLGLPEELVTQMLATDVFFDCFCTAFNQIAVPLTLVLHADSIGMLSDEVVARLKGENFSKYDFQLEKKLRNDAPQYHRVFKSNVKTCQKLLSSYTSLFPTYTDHSSLHSMQLINFCNSMVGKNLDKLNCDEIFVLLMSAYLHDVGMGLGQEDYDEFSAQLPMVAKYRQRHIEQPDSEVIRHFHNEFSGCYIRKYADSLELPTPQHLHAIVQVSRGHRKLDLMDEKEFPTEYRLENGSVVRLSYLAALIRLADELDIAADRNFDFISLPRDIEKESLLAFQGHQAIHRMEMMEDRFVFYVQKNVDEELRQHLDRIFEKLRETLNDCIHVTETRTEFVIHQKFIEVRYE